ncbi:MAG: DUF6125 family protein [Thermodesulfobacteriota bacterium]|nr:DUF6125 family protein [Thermodesulfobacteriota bacterium]
MVKISLEDLPQKTLVDLFKVYSENTVTVDTLWFLNVEERYGLETALEIDKKNRARYGITEAIRLKRVLNIPEDGGISALAKALNFQIAVPCMGYEISEVTEKKAVFTITDCAVQRERIKENRQEYDCKPARELQFANFAKRIDPRIETRCLMCYPDKHSEGMWCSWEFQLIGEHGERNNGEGKIDYFGLSKELLVKLIKLYSKSVVTIDGLWFINLEEMFNLNTAVELDIEVWEKYGVIEAMRLMKVLDIPEGGGIPAIVKALNFQIWAPDMEYEFADVSENKAIFNITDCVPQKLRKRDNRGEFPCKPVGVALFRKFAERIDPRLKMRCLVCPPDEHPDDLWCSWEFQMEV